MKLATKIFLSITFIMIVAFFSLWFFIQTINPQSIKNFLNKQLSRATAQPSRIEGELTWQLFPKPRIKIKKVSIGDHSSPNPYSLRVNELYFNLQLSPLLHKKIVFDEIVVDGFELTLNSAAMHKDSMPDKNAATALKKTTKTTSHSTLEFLVQAISFKKGSAHILTQEGNITIKELQARATHVDLESTFPVQVRGKIDSTGGKHLLKGAINFTGTIHPQNKQFLSLQNNELLKGQLLLDNIVFDQLNISKIRADVAIKNQLLTANPLNFNLYQGESLGDLSFDFKSKKININQTISGLSSQQFSQAILNKSFISGVLDGSLHASTNLSSHDWLSPLRANGTISIHDGTLQWINFTKLLDLLVSEIKTLWDSRSFEKSLEKLFNLKIEQAQNGSTPFKILTLRYDINRLNMLDHDFIFQAQDIEFTGKGTLNLQTLHIQNSLSAKFLAPKGTIREIQQALGGTFPLMISGNLPDPSIAPDFDKISKSLSKAILKKTLKQSIKHLQLDLLLQ